MALGYIILDSGKEFIVVSEQKKITAFEYGQFCLSVCNMDYDKTEERVQMYSEKNYEIKDMLSHCINSLYLTWEQANVVIEMIAEEINENGVIVGGVDSLPDIYKNKELRHHIRKLLERDFSVCESEIQSELDSVILNQSIIMFDGVPMTGYFLNTIKDFLIVDVQKFLLSNCVIKECEYCKRLFIPSRKSDKYCRLPNLERLTCGELAHKNRSKTDFERLCDKARPEQRSTLINISTTKKYDVDILQQMYDDWSLECGKQYKKYKAKNDLGGFKKWIEKTKYTPSKIKNEYQKRLKTKENVKR
ncbi:MAG: hypothetical protein IKM28_02365 [Lachnospiraceae bacterium]|nr:hypothetical protein [Lachnospiraceae bacterium]